jgi:hypothetical protein
VGVAAVSGPGARDPKLKTFLISLVQADSGWLALVPGMAVLGTGVGLFYSSVTTAGVTVLDPSRANLAGGIIYMFRIAGGSLGLGLTTTVFTTASEDRLQSAAATARVDEGVREAVQECSFAGTDSARQAMQSIPADAEEVLALVRGTFVLGMQWGFRYVAALALIGLVVTVLFVAGSVFRRPGAGTAGAAGPT